MHRQSPSDPYRRTMRGCCTDSARCPPRASLTEPPARRAVRAPSPAAVVCRAARGARATTFRTASSLRRHSPPALPLLPTSNVGSASRRARSFHAHRAALNQTTTLYGVGRPRRPEAGAWVAPGGAAKASTPGRTQSLSARAAPEDATDLVRHRTLTDAPRATRRSSHLRVRTRLMGAQP